MRRDPPRTALRRPYTAHPRAAHRVAQTLLALLLLGLMAAACQRPSDLASTPPSDADWTQWRGPNRNGHASSAAFQRSSDPELPPTLRETWRRSLGAGFSSPIAVDDRIYVPFSIADDEFLAAVHLETGEDIWQLSLGPALRDSHGDGPRSTPAYADGRLFVLSSRGRLVAATDSGEEIWRHQLMDTPTWGYASSPLILDQTLIIHGRLFGRQAVLALDVQTGEPRWTVDSDHPGYASPLVIDFAGQRQIVSVLGDTIHGIDPQTGTVQWSYPWQTAYSVNAADPIFLPPNRLFISSGYLTGAAMLQLESDGPSMAVRELWRSREMRNHFNSSVWVDGTLYGFDNSILKALDPETGATHWRHRGLGKGSLIASGHGLLLLSETGTLVWGTATSEAFTALGQAEILTGRTWTAPIALGPWVLLRDHQDLVLVEIQASSG